MLRQGTWLLSRPDPCSSLFALLLGSFALRFALRFAPLRFWARSRGCWFPSQLATSPSPPRGITSDVEPPQRSWVDIAVLRQRVALKISQCKLEAPGVFSWRGGMKTRFRSLTLRVQLPAEGLWLLRRENWEVLREK